MLGLTSICFLIHLCYSRIMLRFSLIQIQKLSDLFMDLAKGLFLAGFAVPIITDVDFAVLIKYFVSAILSLYFSLKLLEIKE